MFVEWQRTSSHQVHLCYLTIVCVVAKSSFTCSVVVSGFISNSMGNKGFLPYTNSYGENLVVLLHVVMYAHIASGSLTSQFL